MDITQMPMHELQKDLEEAQFHIYLCEIAINTGLQMFKGELLTDVIATDRAIIAVIKAEIQRRNEVGDGFDGI